MLKGTRILFDEDANEYISCCDKLRKIARHLGYKEVVLPLIWEQDTFTKKLGEEKTSQMWKFRDKGDRDVCLIPEATALIQEQYNNTWKNSLKKPIKLFYITRCYRYDRPQLGRLREFTQFGVEVLGDINLTIKEQVFGDMKLIFREFDLEYNLVENVKRGISYYEEEGFEVECQKLGAQKQVAGGGKYKEGFGWALGVERLLLAK